MERRKNKITYRSKIPPEWAFYTNQIHLEYKKGGKSLRVASCENSPPNSRKCNGRPTSIKGFFCILSISSFYNKTKMFYFSAPVLGDLTNLPSKSSRTSRMTKTANAAGATIAPATTAAPPDQATTAAPPDDQVTTDTPDDQATTATPSDDRGTTRPGDDRRTTR